MNIRRFTPLAVALAAVPLLAFGPAERTAPTHWALIVGISDYVHFGDEPGGDLPGAEHDARAWRDVLVARYGFPAENVRLLLSREATRAGIEAGLREWLPSVARPGDNVLFIYSGHGSQMWDENGDEDDGLDETLAPADVESLDTSFDIGDDEIGEWLGELPTENVVVFLDNCNSGTGTRDVTPFARTRQLGRDVEEVEKPASVARRALPGQEDETGFDPSGVNVLELSAAQPSQAAVDAYFPGDDGSEPFHGGAFSTFMIRQLWRAPASATYEDVFEQTRDALRQNRFEQDPYLSADVERKSLPVFFIEGGSGSAGAAAVLPVTGVDGSTVELLGGHGLGVTTGSALEMENGARVVVETVRPGGTMARILSGSVEVGMRARLVGYRYTSPPLRVGVAGADPGTVEALRQRLGHLGTIVLVEDPEAYADLLLRRRADEIFVIGADGARRHSFLAGEAEADALAAVLRREAGAQRLGDMENPAQEFGVRVWMDGEGTELGIGELVVLHAESERDGYLTVVDLGTNGDVMVLLPNPYQADNRIEGGETFTFPSEEMGFDIPAQPPAGRGMVRAFLTPEPLDIPLDGEDFIGGGVLLADSIARAVRAAAGMVEGAPQAVRLDNWGSASLIYTIHP